MQVRGAANNEHCPPAESLLEPRSLEMKSPLGYVIMAGPYLSNSAGVICLHRLCDALNRLGYPSFVSVNSRTIRVDASQEAPHLNAKLIEWHVAEELCAQGYTAVYPETISGNPWRAASVVRWVLNRPGLLGGEERYDESEKVFYYTDLFLPYIKNRVAGKLHMPTIDQSLFFCEDGKESRRSLDCFYVGKSKWQEGIFDPAQVLEITRTSPPKKELGKLFRATRVLYCFDNSTILAYEALLCGCKVVIIPDGTQTKEDYQKLELGMEGIAWGVDELPQVETNVSALRARYAQLEQDFQTQLQQFVAITHPQAVSSNSSTNRLPSAEKAGSAKPLVWKSAFREIQFKAREVEQRFRRWKKAVQGGGAWRRMCQAWSAKWFPPKDQGFVIVLPPLGINVGYVESLERLGEEIRRRGVKALVTRESPAVRSRDSTTLDWEVAKTYCSHQYKVIYPDCIAGNPLNAKSVIRWVLHRPGTHGGEEVFAEAERVFCASEVFRHYVKNPLAGMLVRPPISRALLSKPNTKTSERGLDCFYVGSSCWKEGMLDRSRVLEITSDVPAKKELGKLLAATRLLYTFDSSTDLIGQALLVGCEVVVIPEGTITKADFQRFERGTQGIAWGLEEIGKSQVDWADQCRRNECLEREFDQQLTELIGQ